MHLQDARVGARRGRPSTRAAAESEASLTLREGVPLQYNFLGYTEPPNRRLMFRMRLTLQPVLRTPEIDRRLHIEWE